MNTKELKKLIKETILKEVAPWQGDVDRLIDDILTIIVGYRDFTAYGRRLPSIKQQLSKILNAFVGKIDTKSYKIGESEEHKIAGQLSVHVQSQGANRVVYSLEDTKSADRITVTLDKKNVLDAVKTMLAGAGLSVRDLQAASMEEQTFGTPGPAPVGEQTVANPLDGLKKDKVKKALYKILKLDSINGKYFGDQSWAPIHNLFDILSKVNIPYKIEKTEYKKNDAGVPISKEWLVAFDFKNEKGKDTFIYLLIVAAGAGTVQDPLSRYDIVSYFTS